MAKMSSFAEETTRHREGKKERERERGREDKGSYMVKIEHLAGAQLLMQHAAAWQQLGSSFLGNKSRDLESARANSCLHVAEM